MRNTGIVGAGARDSIWNEIGRLCLSRGMEKTPGLPGVVAESWKRCLADYNLTPDRVPRASVLTVTEVRDLMEEREDFVRVAEPEIERLFLRLVDSEYLVSLASAQGVTMLYRCDYQYLGELASCGVLPGSVWSEAEQGTNGVGTCLHEGGMVQIVGKQHYGLHTQALTCIAVPVYGRGGAVECALNVTTARLGDGRVNRVVQDVVQRSAWRIENGHFARIYRDHAVLRLSDYAGDADPVDEGRLVLDAAGRIVDGTSRTAGVLRSPARDLVGAAAEDLFDLPADLGSVVPGRPFALTFRGRRLQGVLTLPETADPPRRSAARPMPAPAARVGTPGGQPRLRPDPVTQQLLDRARRLLAGGLPLIVSGETGTGKSEFALAAAHACFDGDGDVIVLDCAMDSGRAGLESVLRDSLARPSACLLLEQFDDLDDRMQKLLLGLLDDRQNGTGRRIGLVAISRMAPEQMLKEGRLRPELLHRLKGASVSLPPLRTTPNLEGVIQTLFRAEQEAMGRSGLSLDREVELALANYHWPGNLRELRNALRHALALAEGAVVELDHLPDDLVEEVARRDLTARSQSEASRIEAALRYNGGNVTLTARYLGVSRATLYRKIQIEKVRGNA